MAASFGKIDEIRQGESANEFYKGTHGHHAGARLISPHSYFDLASLTKVLATTLLAMIKVERAEMSLDQPLSQLLPEYVALYPDMGKVTMEHLLTHTSGLPAWSPIYEKIRERFSGSMNGINVETREAAFREFLDQIRPELPVGERIVYSDLGFLLLERLLSSNFGEEIHGIYSRVPSLGLHFRPIGLSSVWSAMRHSVESTVMTEVCPWRGPLQGQVHDDNAWSKGGVAGHAGIFGTLRDVLLWIEALFSEKWVSRKTLRQFADSRMDASGNRRAIGFDLPAIDGLGSTGFSFSLNSIGHLGFTGTSIWMDLDSGDYAILLTNRVHPSRSDDRIRKLRREFHRMARGD